MEGEHQEAQVHAGGEEHLSSFKVVDSEYDSGLLLPNLLFHHYLES